MERVATSVLTLTLLGLISAHAEEPPGEVAAESDTTTEASFTWDAEAASRSLLLPQLNAVYRSLSVKHGIEVETTQVTLADNDVPSRDLGNCKHMPRPGSRFMTTRCFYSSAGEAALNDYQFRAEIEQARDQYARDFLEIAEYSLAYRRYLANGGGPMD